MRVEHFACIEDITIAISQWGHDTRTTDVAVPWHASAMHRGLQPPNLRTPRRRRCAALVVIKKDDARLVHGGSRRGLQTVTDLSRVVVAGDGGDDDNAELPAAACMRSFVSLTTRADATANDCRRSRSPQHGCDGRGSTHIPRPLVRINVVFASATRMGIDISAVDAVDSTSLAAIKSPARLDHYTFNNATFYCPRCSQRMYACATVGLRSTCALQLLRRSRQ